MQMASLMGAVAFQKGLGIVHSLAHPLSSLLDTHHGLANAVNLPYGMTYNYNGLEERFDKMATAFGLGDKSGDKLVDYLFEMNQKLGLPTKLSALEVKPEHVDALSDLGVQDFCLPSNPKPAEKEDFIKLYTHDNADIYGVVTKGEITLTLDGKTTKYGVGDWYHIPINTGHTTKFEKETDEIEFWFDPNK